MIRDKYYFTEKEKQSLLDEIIELVPLEKRMLFKSLSSLGIEYPWKLDQFYDYISSIIKLNHPNFQEQIEFYSLNPSPQRTKNDILNEFIFLYHNETYKKIKSNNTQMYINIIHSLRDKWGITQLISRYNHSKGYYEYDVLFMDDTELKTFIDSITINKTPLEPFTKELNKILDTLEPDARFDFIHYLKDYVYNGKISYLHNKMVNILYHKNEI